MKMSEIKDLGLNELEAKAKDLSEELFKLKFQHSIRQLENTAKLNDLKKDIARIKTAISAKKQASA